LAISARGRIENKARLHRDAFGCDLRAGAGTITFLQCKVRQGGCDRSSSRVIMATLGLVSQRGIRRSACAIRALSEGGQSLGRNLPELSPDASTATALAARRVRGN
jgi:hypothetical protein